METYVFFSYALAATAYALLLVIALPGLKKSAQSVPFLLAIIASLIWSSYTAYTQYFPDDNALVSDSMAFETLRNSFWFLLLGTILSRLHYDHPLKLFYHSPFSQGLTLFSVWLCLFEASDSFRALVMAFTGTKFHIRLISHLLYAIIGLVLIEQLYRGLIHDQRWAVKFLCIALGSMFMVDFIVYSKSFKRARIFRES